MRLSPSVTLLQPTSPVIYTVAELLLLKRSFHP